MTPDHLHLLKNMVYFLPEPFFFAGGFSAKGVGQAVSAVSAFVFCFWGGGKRFDRAPEKKF